MAARSLLVESRSAGNEETWNTLVAKFPPEDHAAVSAAAAAAVPARATEVEDGNAPPWCPDDEYASEVLFDVINSRSSLSGAGNDGQRVFYVQPINQTDIGRKESGSGMTAFWRRIVDEPDAFPPEVWQLFQQSSLTALGGKCRPVCVGVAWRRLITAGAKRQWRPRLEEVNREVRQFGVAVLGGVEHVGLRVWMLHETRNWLVFTDCSNAFNTVKRTAVLEAVAKSVAALTPLGAKRYGPRPADVVFRMDFGEIRTVACSSGVRQGNPMGPATFYLALRPGLKRFRLQL